MTRAGAVVSALGELLVCAGLVGAMGVSLVIASGVELSLRARRWR